MVTGRGDIRAIPFALLGGYGLPWPYAVAFAWALQLLWRSFVAKSRKRC